MSKPTAVMQVEGVLRKPVGGAVLDSGRRLYHGLAGTFRLVLVSHDEDKRYVNNWLSMEGFTKHDHIASFGEWRPRADNEWVGMAGSLKLQYGYNTELFVVPAPHDAAALIEHGYNALLFIVAAYALPEWRPDTRKGVRPWSELMAEIDVQRYLRAGDKRMDRGIE